MGDTSLTLNTGYKIPTMALGCAVSPEQVRSTICSAIECGYRHLDNAWLYGTEKEVGDTLQELYKGRKIKREDIFITSKLWSQFNDPKDVREGFMESLNKLQTEYLDLFLIHMPCALPKGERPFPQDDDGKFLHNERVHYVDTWKELEKLQKEGLIRSLGISNFNEYQINKLMKECSIKPAVHQIESHPYLSNEDQIKFCQSNGITVMAYATLGSPARAGVTENDPVILDDPVLKSIAEKRGKTPAQIAIRFQIQRGVVAIAKSANPERQKSNIQVYDFKLTEDEMKQIYGLNRNLREFSLDWCLAGHKYWAYQPNYSED